MRARDLADTKTKKQEAMKYEREEKERALEAELTFTPNIGLHSRNIAERRPDRSISNFLKREEKFLADREFKRGLRIDEKLNTEASELTF